MEENRLISWHETSDLSGFSILEITPLSRYLREKLENGGLGLEESYHLMVSLSDLIAEKSCWLLPLSGLGREEAASFVSEEDAGEEAHDGWFPDEEENEVSKEATMGKEEIAFAVKVLSEKLDYAGRMFPRAFFPKPKGAILVAETLSLDLLRQAAISLLKERRKEERVLVIPRWNFVHRLKLLWREIRRVSAKAVVMRFSWFLGKEKNDCILNFLVFLELIKRGRLFAKQKDPSGEIFFSTQREALLADDMEVNEVGH